MRIPVLAYEPMRIDGNDYGTNDICALEADMAQIAAAGYRIMPLRSIIDAWLDGPAPELDERIVAITCDNGADFDFVDLVHPTAGKQRSVMHVLRRFADAATSPQNAPHVTSFVIVSPDARNILDRTCMVGQGWWSDDWWPEAVKSNLMHIGNHSWDYNHETLPPDFGLGGRRGTFLAIDSLERAEYEIAKSSEYLRSHVPNPGMALLAYPYGESSTYLVREYLPTRGVALGLRAAFTTWPGFLERGTSRWEIPRFVFRRDWASPGELQAILAAAASEKSWAGPVTQSCNVSQGAPTAVSIGPSLKACDDFIATRIERIPGWLMHESALLTMHLASAQQRADVNGPTLEIGVYKGKYLAVLYTVSDPNEPVLGIDLFVGSSDNEQDMALVKSNIADACGNASRLKLMAADSTALKAHDLLSATNSRKFRFISIDGGHTPDVVYHDLETAYAVLCEGGIIAVDDIFNPLVPGVNEGVARFFIGREPALAPFAYCFNKLFVTTPRFHQRYLSEALAFLGEVTWLRTHERTLRALRENSANRFTPTFFGHEIVSFEP